MTNVLYAKQSEDYSGEQLTAAYLRDFFSDAAALLARLRGSGLRVAFGFIDPLMDAFEAGNRFYFQILDSGSLPGIRSYRSGAGPIQALAEAREMIEHGLCDAAALFAWEPLQRDRLRLGRAEVQKAMAIFGDVDLVRCYSALAARLAEHLDLDAGQFRRLADLLYENYGQTYRARCPGAALPEDRGRDLTPLFRLSDCANPNIDYAGGLILGNDKALACLDRDGARPIRLLAAETETVRGGPDQIGPIAGTREDPFPHLYRVRRNLERETGLSLPGLLEDGRLLLGHTPAIRPSPWPFCCAAASSKAPGRSRTFWPGTQSPWRAASAWPAPPGTARHSGPQSRCTTLCKRTRPPTAWSTATAAWARRKGWRCWGGSEDAGWFFCLGGRGRKRAF